MNGREKLKKSVIKDCIDGENCFNQDGCDKTGYTKCSHRYCNTYKWALDRAKYYADATGLSVDEILDLWEENRSYWYMNYYQDSRQPLITDGKVRVFSNVDEFLGSIDRDKGFRCPKCSGQSSNPYECSLEGCDWKAYGLFGTLGKGIYVLIKEKCQIGHIFMPISWES